MKKRTLAGLALLPVVIVLAVLDLPVLSLLMKLLLAALAILALLWGFWRFYRAALWKVGRRLAFSYFLLGVLPIPLLILLLGAIGYLLSGFLVGHLYGDAVADVQAELDRVAAVTLARLDRGGDAAEAAGGGAVAVASYRDGVRVGGDPRLPAAWPPWAGEAAGEEATGGPRYFTRPDRDEPTLAAAAGDAERGAVALYSGDLAEELSERSGVWVDLMPPGGAEDPGMTVRVGQREFALADERPAGRRDEAQAFFAARRDGEEPGLWRRPILWWGEAPGPLRGLADGSPVAPYIGVTLNATPRAVQLHLLSSNAELDAQLWAALFAFAFLLFDVYVVAALMASVLIFTLSQAVNRLSRATGAVRGGDFSVRIPVKRKDQVGELQRSFNQMAEELEQLVATAAEKEILEKELEIARELQRSLVPRDLPGGEAVEFSTLFAPSAAIGGDYFDVLGLGDGRLAVVVADVSGHGLPSGLRMAMLKAALTILVEQERRPEEILHRLDEMVRSGDDRRVFVTATLALVDLEGEEVEITNAGHPPTYLLRRGEVEEIALPGSPLGGLGQTYGRRRLDIEPGDVLVWLSDGLIEATDASGRAFGYDGVARAIAAAAVGPLPTTATLVRDRLLTAVEEHTGGRPVEDDRTVVVMRYKTASPPPGDTLSHRPG